VATESKECWEGCTDKGNREQHEDAGDGELHIVGSSRRRSTIYHTSSIIIVIIIARVISSITIVRLAHSPMKGGKRQYDPGKCSASHALDDKRPGGLILLNNF